MRGPITPLLNDNDEIVESGLVEQALAFVQRNIPIIGQLEEGGARRQEIPIYPREAVREAIVNALVHRDYLLSSTLVGCPLLNKSLAVAEDALPVRFRANPVC